MSGHEGAWYQVHLAVGELGHKARASWKQFEEITMTVTSWPDLYPAESTVDLRRLSPGDAGRLVDITLTFARHGAFLVARRGHLLVLQPHRRGPVAFAVALRRSFSDLGPTFVKFGQLIASSPGLFPEVLAHEFRRLLDQLPAEPADRVRAVIESQFGVPIATLFAEFNDEPVAAASIAQVHAATLRDGTRVAVKVRRPRLKLRVEQDLRLLRLLAGILQHAGTVGALANPVAIVEDFAATLRSELDFRNEGANMAEFARNLAAGDNYRIVVPLPVEGMVSPRVLVMTYIDGTPIDDIESLRASGHDGQELLRIAVRAWI
ncbi:MAG TPA: AarF/UbiB family protein, partial [Acidimicrobiales bacterium]|nr:AarF/UbiB family protein [Acidimicrobiales bacterium]